MMFGEFTSVTTIHSLIPGLAPAPHGLGKYRNGSPDTYCFLSDFLDMDTAAPEPAQFTARVAELHRKSKSPNGKFSFEVTTCDGKLPHTVAWEESWAVFFGKLLRGVLKLDTEVNGWWPELEDAAEQVIAGVIPRSLGVLQADGRKLKPSLIHGDCWEGMLLDGCIDCSDSC
jgi:fructosamine-3-kinase